MGNLEWKLYIEEIHMTKDKSNNRNVAVKRNTIRDGMGKREREREFIGDHQ